MLWSKSKSQNSQTESRAAETTDLPAPVTQSVMERYGGRRRGSVTSSVARSSVGDSSSMHRQPAVAVASTSTPGEHEKAVVQEEDMEEHLYEVNMPQRRRNWLRQHWFVISACTIALVVIGTLVGVVIVKTGVLDRPANVWLGATSWSYGTSDSPFGELTSTSTSSTATPAPGVTLRL